MRTILLAMPEVPRPRASPQGLDPATRGRIARWQELTLRGNLGWEANRTFEARRCHLEALAVADELLDAAALGVRDAGRCGLLLFGMSCNSLVALARQQNDLETEGIFLYRAVDRFIALARSSRAPLRFRSRCLLHLRLASEALYRYFEGRGMWDAAASYSQQANAAMFEVRRLESAARQRARLAKRTAPLALPELPAQARSIRIEVAGSSPRSVAAHGHDGEQDEVQRVLDATFRS